MEATAIFIFVSMTIMLCLFLFILNKQIKTDGENMSKIKFRYNQKVTIRTGFYNGFKGTIKEVEIKVQKDKYTEREIITYIVEVDAKDKILTEKFSENDLTSGFF